MSSQWERVKNVSEFVRGVCIPQRKIVSNIFKCNLIFSSLI